MEETKKELMAYLQDKRLLQDKEEELENLITKATKITTELSDMPKGTPEVQDRMAEYAAMIVELKNEKYNQIIEMHKSKKIIEDRIDMLEQPYRNILYYRYIKGMKLKDVANKMGYNYKWICELHGSALLKYKTTGQNRLKPTKKFDIIIIDRKK